MNLIQILNHTNRRLSDHLNHVIVFVLYRPCKEKIEFLNADLASFLVVLAHHRDETNNFIYRRQTNRRFQFVQLDFVASTLFSHTVAKHVIAFLRGYRKGYRVCTKFCAHGFGKGLEGIVVDVFYKSVKKSRIHCAPHNFQRLMQKNNKRCCKNHSKRRGSNPNLTRAWDVNEEMSCDLHIEFKDSCTYKAILLGFDEESKTYRVFQKVLINRQYHGLIGFYAPYDEFEATVRYLNIFSLNNCTSHIC